MFFGIIIYIIIHIKKKLHTSQLAVYLYSQRDEKMIVSCDSSLVVVFTFLTATAIKSPPTFDGAYICSYFSQLTMCVCCVHYILYTNPFFREQCSSPYQLWNLSLPNTQSHKIYYVDSENKTKNICLVSIFIYRPISLFRLVAGMD